MIWLRGRAGIVIRGRNPFLQHRVKHGQQRGAHEKTDNPAKSESAQHAQQYYEQRNPGAPDDQHGPDHVVDLADRGNGPD